VPVETHVARARSRADAEREAVDAKHSALGAFVDRVEALSPEPTSPAPEVTATAGVRPASGSPPDDRCRSVREAFAGTVRPHSVDDADDAEPLLETIGSELSDSIAVALAPTTDASFSPELKRMVVSAAASRRAETAVMRRALTREMEVLEAAEETVDTVTAWVADRDETPLTELGFEALRRRHEDLAEHRERCDALARDRQSFLQGTTSQSAEVGIDHRSLVTYLYADFPVDHPVLATAARLGEVCADCQRAVRDHLVRRV
jgi:hypothetical protein